MSSIVAIGTALPEFGIDQMLIHAFMDSEFSGNDDDRKKLKLLYERSAIQRRYSVMADFAKAPAERTFFRLNEPQPTLEQRLQQYYQFAPELAVQSISNAVADFELKTITHFITVSCTGMWAPGLDIEVMKKIGLNDNVHRTSVNFMGCYAAIHALKMADAICKSDRNARVLVVSVELCTLHFQRSNDPEQLTANALFADGAAACLVVPDDVAQQSNRIKIHTFFSKIIPETQSDMAWHITSNGFLMQLSSYVPQLIQQNLPQLMQDIFNSHQMTIQHIAGWMIHPGGRKILDHLATELSLTREQLKYSYDTLTHYGNMSSATLLFVLHKAMQDDTLKGKLFGAAFGPGLTVETFIAEK
jgi:predicted naringenin-chalcone synthase